MALTSFPLANEILQNALGLQPQDEQERLSLLQSARTLVNHLEQPNERLMRMCYLQPALFMATKVLSDLSVFKKLARSTEPLAASEMAVGVGADPVLVARLMKHIATESFVDESGPAIYAANDTTRCLALTAPRGLIDNFSEFMPITDAFPEFLRETKYMNPTDKDQSGFKYAYNTDQHYFDYLASPGQERKLEALSNHMAFKTVGLKWYQAPEIIEGMFGDVATKLGKDDVLLIDVGGNKGLPGRLILQDMPKTIQSIDMATLASQGIEAISHDFSTAQPIHGAKAYYLKMVLHDWPDQECIQILSHIKPALNHGYSRILVNEIVIPDVKASWLETRDGSVDDGAPFRAGEDRERVEEFGGCSGWVEYQADLVCEGCNGEGH